MLQPASRPVMLSVLRRCPRQSRQTIYTLAAASQHCSTSWCKQQTSSERKECHLVCAPDLNCLQVGSDDIGHFSSDFATSSRPTHNVGQNVKSTLPYPASCWHKHFTLLQGMQNGMISSSYSTLSSSSIATQTTSSFLHPKCGDHPRQSVRHSSTEPTTLYEGLLNSQPVHFAESIFQNVQSLMGLPWWATIVATTFTLRLTLTLPLAVFSQNIRARVESLQPEVIALAKRAFVQRFAARAKSEQWSEKRAQRAFVGLVKRYSRELYVRDNCHPAKGSILLLVQLPMWIFLSLSLRNMTGAFSERMYVDPSSIVPELTTGGTLWFASLAAPDPTMILPVMVGVLNLANIEMHALHKGRVTRGQRYLNNTLRTISVIMIPIAAYVPSAMSLYWMVSALYGLGQNILLKIPSARRTLGIRPSKGDSDTPFLDMREEFVERYIKRSRGGEGDDERLEEMKDEEGGGEVNRDKKTKL